MKLAVFLNALDLGDTEKAAPARPSVHKVNFAMRVLTSPSSTDSARR